MLRALPLAAKPNIPVSQSLLQHFYSMVVQFPTRRWDNRYIHLVDSTMPLRLAREIVVVT